MNPFNFRFFIYIVTLYFRASWNMSPSAKKSRKKSKAAVSEPKLKMDDTYCMLRDQDSEKLLVVPRTEIISAKKPSKLAMGDIVSHGKRGKRIRAEILLVGKISHQYSHERIIGLLFLHLFRK
jgi:hypothetical protein